MGIWNKTFLKFTLIEWAVALLVLLMIARFIWAEEATRLEDSLFESIGLGGGAKYLITIPLVVWYLYWRIKGEREDAARGGVPVVRPIIWFAAVGLLGLAVVILVFSAAG